MTDKEKEERQKLLKVVQQAMNIQIMEMSFQMANSDGDPIEGTDRIVSALYNRETISDEEVKQVAKHGGLAFDERIIVTDPIRIGHVFPHRGELGSSTPHAYWKPLDLWGERFKCQCSECGFVADAEDAVERGNGPHDYVGVKYRYCPGCGLAMSHKKGG